MYVGVYPYVCNEGCKYIVVVSKFSHSESVTTCALLDILIPTHSFRLTLKKSFPQQLGSTLCLKEDIMSTNSLIREAKKSLTSLQSFRRSYLFLFFTNTIHG